MWHNRSSLLGKFQITIWNFPNSELWETHFHAFYPHTSLLLWQIILNYIILIFFLDCFIVLYLLFYILGWSLSKTYGRYIWTGLTPSQVLDSLPEILLGVCSSAENYVINFIRCHQSFWGPSFSLVVLFLIVYWECFNITFYYSFIYSLIRF